ncbi:hypothetical protein CAEBREN_13191 [Caenorhabditis brenneri]|uniref:Fas apoptotic inhibitory molecule 1 n=1 Tax=Caenorhabditis brenneri TaxID=135651 RepID=G0NZL2_CAEBE|nr:hypothetical protein CAEBREN_13191 [Caenorhabditis brenneri]
MPEPNVSATWTISLQKQVHKVEFEHGTTFGRRVIRVDGKEVLRREWMFKLVGKENFNIGKILCEISIEAVGTSGYEYTLHVNGKTFEKFKQEQDKKLQSWETTTGGHEWRVVLYKETMEVWANGTIIATAGEFVEGGSLTHCELNSTPCRITTKSSGNKKTGLIHTLYVNNTIVPSKIDDGQASSSSSS